MEPPDLQPEAHQVLPGGGLRADPPGRMVTCTRWGRPAASAAGRGHTVGGGLADALLLLRRISCTRSLSVNGASQRIEADLGGDLQCFSMSKSADLGANFTVLASRRRYLSDNYGFGAEGR